MDTNITIIGAGVVGLAIAAKLSESFNQVFVLEKNEKFGMETSSRNSEVIHSGIYYPTNSLKAKLCVEGNRLLYQYCQEKGIANKKCGKIMVATTEQEIEQLNKVLYQSKVNGVSDGFLLNEFEIKDLEPNIRAIAGLYYPSTGIIDSYGLMKQLAIDASIKGTEFVYRSELIGIKRLMNGYELTIKDNTGTFSFTSNIVINSAGLHSNNVSQMLGIIDNKYKIHYWKGEYFAIGNGKNRLIKRLIYPVPLKNTTGLGVHATIDLSNGVKLGPNALYLENNRLDYSVDPAHRKEFFDSAKCFLPFLKVTDLRPDQSGIRPKLQKPGDTVRDFVIKNESDRGYPNFINLIGIESPGLTSCLSIAEYVSRIIN